MAGAGEVAVGGDDAAPAETVARPAGRAAAVVPGPVAALGLFALAVVLPLLRQQGNRSWDSLWAEDGSIFYQQALDNPGLRVLLRGYNGYLVLPPRLLCLPAPWLPVARLPLYFAVTSGLVGALLAAFAYRASRGWIPSRSVRLALASLVVLMPAMGLENTASVTNTIWTFAAVAPWAFVSLEERRWDVVARSAVAFLTATGTVLGFVFIPLAVGWACVRKTRATFTVLAVYGAGLLLQGVVMLRTASEILPVPPQRPLSEIIDLIGVRVFALYLVGPDRAVSLWKDHGLAVVIGSAVVVTTVFAVAAWRTERRRQVLGLTLLGYSIGSFVVLVWGRGTLPFRFTGTFDMFAAMRYSVPSTLMLASGLAVLLAPTRPVRGFATARWVFVGHVAVLIIAYFSVTGYRALGPSWSEQVRSARQECRGAAPDHEVAIAQDALKFSKIRVHCRDLES